MTAGATSTRAAGPAGRVEVSGTGVIADPGLLQRAVEASLVAAMINDFGLATRVGAVQAFLERSDLAVPRKAGFLVFDGVRAMTTQQSGCAVDGNVFSHSSERRLFLGVLDISSARSRFVNTRTSMSPGAPASQIMEPQISAA